MVREAEKEDLGSILELYLCLHERSVPEASEELCRAWKRILEDEDHHLIVNEVDGRIAASCVCVVIPNLTRGGRPYALVENVVTHTEFRGRGLALACLEYAKEIARRSGCYKMMLLTGSKEKETLAFYRKAGYNSEDKTAFVQWLDFDGAGDGGFPLI